MIDRNDIDQRIAAHTTTVARINETGWQRQGEPELRAIRTALAAALVALAARLDPAARPARRDVAALTAY
jgi:hypothetical protein